MNDDPVFFSASAHHALAYITDPDPAAVAETAVALANTDGGTLLIQGDMDGAALPVLLAYAAEQCNPAIVFGAPRPVTTGDGPAVAVHVLRGTCVHALADGQVLVRIYQANQPLNGDQIRRLVSARTNGDFDAEVVPGAVLDDLSPDLIDNYLTCAPTFRHGAEDGYSVENKLRDVDAVTPEGGITVAGMLLFGIDPQRWLPHSAVRFICMIGKYPGGSGKAGRAFEQVVGGASVRLIDDLWALIQEQMPQQRVTGTPGKQCYPAAAVREALLNAVIHRNYRLRHRSVKVMLYADQLLVTSPGGLPGFMTMDTLTGGCFSRNPRLSRVLREWDTASPSGMGIRGMMAQTAQHGCPPLAIEARPRTVTVRFYGAQAGAELPHDLAADNAGDDRLTARQQHVLDHLTQHGSITLRELATLFPGVRSEHLQRDLAHLTAAGHLRKIGPRGGAYYIRS